jgi:hypothetical protein
MDFHGVEQLIMAYLVAIFVFGVVVGAAAALGITWLLR